jgi:hypothetical protein
MTPAKRYLNLTDVPGPLLAKYLTQSASAVEQGECRVWSHRLDRYGYGDVKVQIDRRVWHIGAHRLAVLLAYGELPPWAVVDHLCRNRACINVAHLRLVTNAENIACGDSHKPRERCKSGHRLNGDNLHVVQRSDGRSERCCRRCRYLAGARYRKRQQQS